MTPGLTHSLDGCACRAENDDHVHQLWLGPSVREFLLKDCRLISLKPATLLISGGILGKHCTHAEGSDVAFITQLVLCCVGSTHLFKLAMAVAGQWIGELSIQVASSLVAGVDRSLARIGHGVVARIVLNVITVALVLSRGAIMNHLLLWFGHVLFLAHTRAWMEWKLVLQSVSQSRLREIRW